MEPGNLKQVKDLHTRENHAAAAAIAGLIVKSDQKNIPGPIPVRTGLHLDVDEVLRRSLPTWPNQHS